MQFSMTGNDGKVYGGDEEIRTPDPLLARQVLSQLSYTPTCFFQGSQKAKGFSGKGAIAEQYELLSLP